MKTKKRYYKRYYRVQIVIDIVLILLGFIVSAFPKISSLNANIVFYTLMSIYAGLEFLEYFISKYSKESIYLAISSSVCAFSGFFLKNLDAPTVLSITLVAWILMISISKIIGFETIYERRINLFIVKLSALSTVILIGILVSINIYFRMSAIGHMLALMYITYGFLELLCDVLDYASAYPKIIKE